MDDIEDEDAADEAGVEAKFVKKNFVKRQAASMNVTNTKASSVKVQKKALRAALRKAVRDPVRGGDPAGRVSTTSPAPPHMSVSTEIEQAESAIKSAMAGVTDRAEAAGKHPVISSKKAKHLGSNGTWTDSNMGILEDMTSFWNNVTDSAAAVLKKAQANANSFSNEDDDHQSAQSPLKNVSMSNRSNGTAATTTKKGMLNTRTTSTSTALSTTTTTTTAATAATTAAATLPTPSAAKAPAKIADAYSTKTPDFEQHAQAVFNGVLGFDAKKVADAVVVKEQHIMDIEKRLNASLDKREAEAQKPGMTASSATANSSTGNRTLQVPGNASAALSPSGKAAPASHNSTAVNATAGPVNKKSASAPVSENNTASDENDAGAAVVEVEEFAPLAFNNANSTPVKPRSDTNSMPSQFPLSVSPPWESRGPYPFGPSSAQVANAMAIPPWLSEGILVKAHGAPHPHMLNTQEDQGKDDVDANEPSDAKVGEKRKTHTIRDAVKAAFNKGGRAHKKLKFVPKKQASPAAVKRGGAASQKKVVLKRFQKEEKGGQKRHTIKDAIQKAVTTNHVVKATKVKEEDTEGDNEQDEDKDEDQDDDEDEDAEDEDDEEGEDDDDREDDDEDEDSEEVQSEDDEDEDDESLLQDAPWVDMPPRSAV